MLNKLAVKRLLAGLIDITIMVAIDKIIVMSGINFTGAPIFYYFLSLNQYNTTVGGVLLNTKVVDSNNNNLGKGKKALRSTIIAIAFLAIGLTQIASKHLGPLLILLAIALPMFLTKNSISLIDLFSRSRVVKDEDNTYKKYKKGNALIFISAIIVIISFWGYLFVRTQNCYDLSHKKEYRLVTEKCDKVAKISFNPDLHFLISASYFQLKEYQNSIDSSLMAGILGHKEAKFLRANSYIAKKEFNKAIDVAETELKDFKMLYTLGIAYRFRYDVSKNIDDLINFHAYMRAFSKVSCSPENKDISKIFWTTHVPIVNKLFKHPDSSITKSDNEKAKIKAEQIIQQSIKNEGKI